MEESFHTLKLLMEEVNVKFESPNAFFFSENGLFPSEGLYPDRALLHEYRQHMKCPNTL